MGIFEFLRENAEIVLTNFLFAYVISQNEVIETILSSLCMSRNKWGQFFGAILYDVLTCFYCASLWLTFIVGWTLTGQFFNSFVGGLLASFIAFFVTKNKRKSS